MDQSVSSQTHSSKSLFAIILGITSVFLLIGAGYLFMNNQSLWNKNKTLANQNSLLQTEVSSLKDEKTQLEKDLIYYKSTDLAKEVEILTLKLKTAEEDLSSTKTALDTLKTEVSSFPKITKIASLMMATFGKQPPNCFSATDTATIHQELMALGDTEWTSKWEDFINETDAKNCSMSPDKLEQAVNYGLTKISEALK